MSNNSTLNSGIRDNLLRGTVHDFLKREIQSGSALSIVTTYFTNKLLDIVISDIKRAHTTVQTKNMGRDGSRDFKLPIASEAPKKRVVLSW